MKFNLKYFLLSLVIFITEVLIATVFRKIFFVRAYLGDVLVVILLYTLVLSFFRVKNRSALVLGIFLFAVGIEVLQYFKLAEILGFAEGSVPYIVLGNSFSWLDVACYAAGCGLVLLINFLLKTKPRA